MEPFVSLTGVAAPLLMDDVNTDQISPASLRGGLSPDYKTMLFSRWREDSAFVLAKPQFKEARILVARDNFGCGSSRESAVWALIANGIRCVIARSIADTFHENCLRNGVLSLALPPGTAEDFEAKVIAVDGAQPFTVDLAAQRILCPDGTQIGFEIKPAERTALLEGLDDIGMTMKHHQEIAAWEERMKRERPWLQSAGERRYH